MTVKFVKMHGLGNDYIFVDCEKNGKILPEKLAKILSRRRFSVGSDGLVFMEKSDLADVKMRIFNADGSEGATCGNALRCVALYFYACKKFSGARLTIQTNSGVRTVVPCGKSGAKNFFTVDMGEYEFSRRGEKFFVKIGNAHEVFFCADVDNFNFEKADFDRENFNAEAVEILSERAVKMRVFERGSGETFSCGSGACAAAVASFCEGKTGRECEVFMPGGAVKIAISDGRAYLTGEAEIAYFGEVEV